MTTATLQNLLAEAAFAGYQLGEMRLVLADALEEAGFPIASAVARQEGAVVFTYCHQWKNTYEICSKVNRRGVRVRATKKQQEYQCV